MFQQKRLILYVNSVLIILSHLMLYLPTLFEQAKAIIKIITSSLLNFKIEYNNVYLYT